VTRLTRLSVARAVAMRALAELQRLDVFSAYLAALFADVGASFLLWAIVDKSRGRVPDPEDALAFVREHHETMSGAVLKRWGHGELVVGLVRRHHAPTLTGPATPLASLLVVASQMARELTGEEDPTAEEPFPPPALLERCLLHANVSQSARDELLVRLRGEFTSALGAVG
jgi:HD-like signal output (HDOD) protein